MSPVTSRRFLGYWKSLAPVFGAMLALPDARAVTATRLASFDGIEEPLVRFVPASGSFTPDRFTNITDEGAGMFRMTLRYRGDAWDADRDTHNTDRQRAEIKGLGPHQFTGETFEYETTWRTDPDFRPADRFCHVFQLKSTDGDSGAPLVTISIEPGEGRAAVKYWSGAARHATDAMTFAWKPGTWQTVRLRIKVSNGTDGEVLASIDGGEFRGVRGIALFRRGATEYRPKWGLYRGVRAGLDLHDDYVEHRGIFAGNSAAPAFGPELETAGVRRADASGPEAALAWLRTQPSSPARTQALATLIAAWAEREPAAAMAAAARLGPAEGRADALLRGFARWTDLDPTGAIAWARAHRPAGELDHPLWYFATDTTLRYVERELALEGASLIVTTELRAAAIEHIVLIWARHAPDEAARYARECPALSPARRLELAARILSARRTATLQVRNS